MLSINRWITPRSTGSCRSHWCLGCPERLPGLGESQELQRPNGPGVETGQVGHLTSQSGGISPSNMEHLAFKHGAFHHISPMDSMEFWISFSEERVRGICFTTIDVAISTGKNWWCHMMPMGIGGPFTRTSWVKSLDALPLAGDSATGSSGHLVLRHGRHRWGWAWSCWGDNLIAVAYGLEIFSHFKGPQTWTSSRFSESMIS